MVCSALKELAVYAGRAVPIGHQWAECWLSRVLAMAGATLISSGPQVCGSMSRFPGWIETVRLITASLDCAHLAAESGQGPAVGEAKGTGDACMEQC